MAMFTQTFTRFTQTVTRFTQTFTHRYGAEEVRGSTFYPCPNWP